MSVHVCNFQTQAFSANQSAVKVQGTDAAVPITAASDAIDMEQVETPNTHALRPGHHGIRAPAYAAWHTGAGLCRMAYGRTPEAESVVVGMEDIG